MHTKHTFFTIGIVLILAIGAYIFFTISQPEPIDTTGKVHTSLYEEAVGTWNPQMQISPFERAPSSILTLTWQPPEESYNHFVITISHPDTGILRSEAGEHDRFSLNPDGLEPDTEYIFAIQACVDPRCEEWIIGEDEYRGNTQSATEVEEEEIK